jgi:serine phosphatase RsbU (regulator of sigma subunit)
MKSANSNLLKYYFVFIILFSVSFSFAQKDTSEIIKIIDEARSEFARDPKLSVRLSYKALSLSTAIKSKRYISKSYNTIGSSYYFLGAIDSSEVYHSRALEIQKEINDVEGIGRSYTNLGSIYSERGMNDKALNNFLMAEESFIKVNYKVGLAKLYNSLGILFYNIRDFEGSVKYFEKGIVIVKELQDEVMYSSLSINLANALSYQGKAKEAINLYLQGYEIAKRNENFSDVTTVCNSLTHQYLSLDNVETAIRFNNEALQLIKEKDQSEYLKISAYGHKGDILDRQGKYKEALPFLDSAIIIAKRTGDLSKEMELYKQLSKTLMHNNEYDKAHNALFFAHVLKDSLYERNLQDRISEVNAIHNVEKKEQEINVLEHKRESDRIIKILSIVGGSIALIALVITIRSYLRGRKQNALIHEQKREVEKKNIIIEHKQKEIIDSINYAKRIQYALLAHDNLLKENLNSFFVLFKPKDIVSGDFYWATNIVQNGLNNLKIDQSVAPNDLSNFKQPLNLFYLAVCDSTGHGVPGAFMSLLNISYLNEAVSEKNIYESGKIFDHVRERLIENISQEGQQDGMDGILLCIDKLTREITYSAANNTPVLVSDCKLVSLVADKMPVGKGERSGAFTTQRITYKKGDILYLYTDGYADQFGGADEKKFKYKQLNDLLIEISSKDMEEQKEILNKRFEDWKGDLEQVDDVCVIGIKL